MSLTAEREVLAALLPTSWPRSTRLAFVDYVDGCCVWYMHDNPPFGASESRPALRAWLRDLDRHAAGLIDGRRHLNRAQRDLLREDAELLGRLGADLLALRKRLAAMNAELAVPGPDSAYACGFVYYLASLWVLNVGRAAARGNFGKFATLVGQCFGVTISARTIASALGGATNARDKTGDL